MEWETVIGLETHAQLSTRSKIFSGASTAFGAAANTQASAVDLALPGVLPALNRGAVERALRFGLAVGATINLRSVFARKNYFYPDLPKGYQISQYELPVVAGGGLDIEIGEVRKTVRLTRAHLEEDAGKSLHLDFHAKSGIDLNRAGTPLLEIVSEPDLRSSAEAVAYAKTLHALVQWLDICDGNMEEGSFRCDANVSVRLAGAAQLGTRCEIKNLNSFRFLERAIDFEVQRQRGIIEDGGRIIQETRLYDSDKDETRPMRSKEDAHDYRYFPDPDLPPLVVSEAWCEAVRASLPELPAQKRSRYIDEYGISPYAAQLLTQTRAWAEYFEAVSAALANPDNSVAKQTANWMTGELAAALNAAQLDIEKCPISAPAFAGLMVRIADKTLSGKLAKEVFAELWNARARELAAADAVIAAKGLQQISDGAAIEGIVDQVLAANARQVADYRSGKQKAFNSLVGQVMKATRGQANPAQVHEALKRKLESPE